MVMRATLAQISAINCRSCADKVKPAIVTTTKFGFTSFHLVQINNYQLVKY